MARGHTVAEVGTGRGGRAGGQHPAHAHAAARRGGLAVAAGLAVAPRGAAWLIGPVRQEIGRTVRISSRRAATLEHPDYKPQNPANYQRADEQRAHARTR